VDPPRVVVVVEFHPDDYARIRQLAEGRCMTVEAFVREAAVLEMRSYDPPFRHLR